MRTVRNVAKSVLVRLSAKDQARVRKIRDTIESVETDEEALLWALRSVIAETESKRTSGGGGARKQIVSVSLADIIPRVPLGDTNLAEKPFKMILDTNLLGHDRDHQGKMVRIHEGELGRLKAIEHEYVTVAQQAHLIAEVD